MLESVQGARVLRFGVFELDLQAGELRRAGLKVKLQEQPFQILVALLEHPGEVVTREALRERLWPADTFVDFDQSLNSAVKKVRQALGDDSDNPRFIETLARRGYRFLVTVETRSGSSIAKESRTGGELIGGSDLAWPTQEVGSHARRSWLWAVAGLCLVAIIGALLWFFSPLPQPRVTASTQITHDSLDKSNIFSDGTRVYFTEFSGERYVLAQVSAAGGETSVIPTPFQNLGIADISSDRSQLLVLSFVGPEVDKALWSLPLPAGPPRRLADIAAVNGTWSPDGQQLLFCKGSELYRANGDGTGARPLLSVNAWPMSARFSPDGKRIRLTLLDKKTDVPTIWELNSDGSNLHRLLPKIQGPQGQCCGRWTSDGRYYVFVGANNLGSLAPLRNIFAVSEPTGVLRRSSPIPVQLTEGPLSFNAVLPAGDGKKLFVLAAQQRGELMKYDANARQFVSFLSGISASDLDFSRDGKWMTYVTIPDGKLWRSRMDGSERLQLTYGTEQPALPRWCPDGSRIVYFAALNGVWKMYLISAQGGEPKALLPGDRSEADPTWSPAATQIAFGRMPYDEEAIIQIVDLRTRQTSVVPGSAGLFSPRWSPNGRYIAALTANSKKLVLYDVSSQKWSDWISGESIGYPTWSADSRYLYFDTTLTKSTSYRRVMVGESHSQSLFSLEGLHRYAGILGTWSGIAPDGSPLFVRDTSTQEIYALDVQFP